MLELSSKQVMARLKAGQSVSIVFEVKNDFEGGSSRVEGEVVKASRHVKSQAYAYWKVRFANGVEETFRCWGSSFFPTKLEYKAIEW